MASVHQASGRRQSDASGAWLEPSAAERPVWTPEAQVSQTMSIVSAEMGFLQEAHLLLGLLPIGRQLPANDDGEEMLHLDAEPTTPDASLSPQLPSMLPSQTCDRPRNAP